MDSKTLREYEADPKKVVKLEAKMYSSLLQQQVCSVREGLVCVGGVDVVQWANVCRGEAPIELQIADVGGGNCRGTVLVNNSTTLSIS